MGFTAEATPRQCGGAKYIFNGSGEVDSKGKTVSSYSKDFFAQCANGYWAPEPLLIHPDSIYSDPLTGFPKFVGYCWPTDPNSCPTCDPDETTWPFISDQSVAPTGVDLTAFSHTPNAPIITPTSWSINDTFSALTEIATDVPNTATPSGVTHNVTVGSKVYSAQTVFTVPTPLNFPLIDIDGYIAEYVVFTDTNNYSAVLTDRYTDAEALANAQIVIGTGATAQNMPRTTGFTSVTTSVVYTILLSNLIVGRDYTVTVDLWEQGESVNTHTPRVVTFTADATTHTILDAVPTPVAGHTITVHKPVIAFAS